METPANTVSRVHREAVIVDRQTIWIERPTDSDKLLDDPAVLAANIKDDYMPYWADIWPASRMMAKALLREQMEPYQRHDGGPIVALELGCGLGLAGIAALKRGLKVIFSDYDLTALKFAERNAKLNGYTDFQLLPLDWRFPPDGLQVPLIIAADLTYEMRNIDPLIALIKKTLLPDGTCLLTDPNRTPAEKLRQRLSEEDLLFTTNFIRAGEPRGDRTKGTLYRIAKK
jgi:predicted nicotinamide N-methyase